MNLSADVFRGWLRRMDALEKGSTRKEQVVRAIERQLTGNLSGVIARLSLEEKCWLAECAHQGRMVSGREFEAKYSSHCPMPAMDYAWNQPVSFLVPFFHLPHYRAWDEACMVAGFEEPLRALLPRPEGVKAQVIEKLPSKVQYLGEEPNRPIHTFESERIALVELARMLRLVQAGKVRLTEASRRPSNATTRLVAQTLIAPDFDLEIPEADKCDWDKRHYTEAGAVRAPAWPVLLQQCGWARGKAGVLTLTAEGRDILEQFTPDKLRTAVSRYFTNNDFDELNRINHIRGLGSQFLRAVCMESLATLGVLDVAYVYPHRLWPDLKDSMQELENKTGACRVSREAVLLEWSDEALARLVATDSGLRRLCFHAGENRLVVPKESLAAFSRAVKKLGYVLPNRR